MDSTATTPQTPAIPVVPLAVSDQQSTALLDDTLALLAAGALPKAEARGRIELERWQAVLSATNRPGLAKIRQELQQLDALLATPDPQPHDLAELLAGLGAETAKVAEEADGDYGAPLTNLSKLLIKAGSSLSR